MSISQTPPIPPTTPSLISFDTGSSTPTNTPPTSQLPTFSPRSQIPPSPLNQQPSSLSRPRALSLLDDDEDGMGDAGPPPALSTPPVDSVSALSRVEIEPPAFLPRRTSLTSSQSKSISGGNKEGLYEGMKGINPDLSASTRSDHLPAPLNEVGRAASFESTGTREESNELYIPGLTSPTLFSQLPATDSLTPLLEKYLPPDARPKRHLNGEWRGSTLGDLITARRWRSVALFCHDTILQIAPEQTVLLLSHWSLRLHALLRLSLIPNVASELSALFSILPPSSYLSPVIGGNEEDEVFHHLVPFEFHVYLAMIPALSNVVGGIGGKGEREKEKSVESLARVIRGCKKVYWSLGDGGTEEQEVWKGRIEAVGELMSGLLRELKAPGSSSSLLSQLPSPILLKSLCKLHISTGNLSSFSSTFSLLSQSSNDDREKRKISALGRVANGEWKEAEEEWRILVQEDKEDYEALNNLAVVLLFASKLQEAITLLTNLIRTQPEIAYTSESLLFNLSTLLELRTENATREKIGLLRNVVAREGGGEGVRAGCFKLAV